MKINRKWAMPNKKTFQIKPIKELLHRYGYDEFTCDPFPFDYKKDATEYLNEFKNNSQNLIVFDPPYSPRQLKECYKGKGEYDTKASTWSNWKKLIAKKIKHNGYIISFGWNSGGIGQNNGMQIEEILLVPHGGMHNDTIVVVEKKI